MAIDLELPDRQICRTELYAPGTKGLYVCRTEHPYLCKYALSFGFDFYFCYHDDRSTMSLALPTTPLSS